MRYAIALTALTAAIVAAPFALAAQDGPAMPTEAPGRPDSARVTAGTYATDPTHTLVGWRVNHFGFNDYFGQFGNITGTMTLDPANPSAATLDISIPISGLASASSALNEHMQRADFFDMANHPTARFVSRRVTVTGSNAAIEGNLTIRGVTRPITLAARFVGAGNNPFNSKATVGFHATATVKRSEFGMGYGIPLVADDVALDISVAFERQSG